MRAMRFLVAAVLVACGGDGGGGDTDETGTTDRVDVVIALTGVAADGEAPYKSTCGICHGDDGTGPISDFTGDVPGLAEEDVIRIIIRGTGTMASQGGNLDDQEIADVSAYVIATFG
jgi:mono/diheme cytochrome c family protein